MHRGYKKALSRVTNVSSVLPLNPQKIPTRLLGYSQKFNLLTQLVC